MRNLLDFILANLIPVIVVVSIVLRIIGGIRSGARKKSQDPALNRAEDPGFEEEGYAGVWERLKPDEESPPDLARGRSSAGAGPSPPPPPEIRPLLMPAGPSRPAPAPVLFSPPEPEVPLFEPKAPGDVRQKPVEKRSPAPFFHRIENLSPLRRAVILAEILGPPRGA
jgi:hypothetical protein